MSKHFKKTPYENITINNLAWITKMYFCMMSPPARLAWGQGRESRLAFLLGKNWRKQPVGCGVQYSGTGFSGGC